MLTASERETLRTLCADEASFAAACRLIDAAAGRADAAAPAAPTPSETPFGMPAAAVLEHLGDSVLVSCRPGRSTSRARASST